MKREIGAGIFDGIGAKTFWRSGVWCCVVVGLFMFTFTRVFFSRESFLFFPLELELSLIPSPQHSPLPHPLPSYLLLPSIPGTHKDCGELGRALLVLFCLGRSPDFIGLPLHHLSHSLSPFNFFPSPVTGSPLGGEAETEARACFFVFGSLRIVI